ncbi:dienelactone hydrolase family protein [Kribbella sp. NBC_01245]|uniref:dienelactone hydrolase family protein n=1 Tax=Kribbella sp. NBC_01245 TaxID=2903578 RepID=UPI002E2C1A80|nr:dienelactone hydrolase family protein [Kribbella sp. NBC_01245]
MATALGVLAPAEVPPVEVDRWRHDGLVTTELSWQTAFGPPTRAWLVRPEHADDRPLPGVLALHCHAGVKHVGAERLVTTRTPSPGALRLRTACYEGQALADGLAREGFAVLAHDAFGWGSRGFRLDPPSWRLRTTMAAYRSQWSHTGQTPGPDEVYDVAAAEHEATVAKYAGVMGTSFAGAVAYDDLTALSVLAATPGVDRRRLGVVGFSGGGGRAVHLAALAPEVSASVVVCMMSTFAALYPAYLDAHSWLLATPGIGRDREWPDLAAARRRHHQLVLYAEDDELFPPQGMADADALLRRHFEGAVGSYRGVMLPGPHRFDRAMQDLAAAFLTDTLAR